MPVARVLLVHAQRTFLTALRQLLEREADLDVVGAVPSVTAALAALDSLAPDVVLVGMDLDVPKDGLELTTTLLDRGRDVPGIVVVGVNDHDLDGALATVRAGATVYVPSDADTDELLDGIRAAADGYGLIPPRLLGDVLRRLAASGSEDAAGQALLDRLTAREQEILHLLVAGQDRTTIARELHLSPNTVRTHVGNLLRKLEVHSTLEAVALAYTHGIRGDGAVMRSDATSWHHG